MIRNFHIRAILIRRSFLFLQIYQPSEILFEYVRSEKRRDLLYYCEILTAESSARVTLVENVDEFFKNKIF